MLFLSNVTNIQAQAIHIGASLDPAQNPEIDNTSFKNWYQLFLISQFDNTSIGFQARYSNRSLLYRNYKMDMPNLKIGITKRFHQYRKTEFLWGAHYVFGMITESFNVSIPDNLGNFYVIEDQSSTFRQGAGIEFIMLHPIYKRLYFVHHISTTLTIQDKDENRFKYNYPKLEEVDDGFKKIEWTLGLSFRL